MGALRANYRSAVLSDFFKFLNNGRFFRVDLPRKRQIVSGPVGQGDCLKIAFQKFSPLISTVSLEIFSFETGGGGGHPF